MNAPDSSSLIGSRYNDSSYLEATGDWHAGDAPWKAAMIARMLKRHGVRPENIAEVGCGSGEVLISLAGAFPESKMTGFELSRDAFAICKPKEREGITFRLEDIAQSDACFDVLMAIDVIEHVEDYIGFLRGIHSLSNYFVFHIPLDIHINALTGGGFARARERVGHLHYFTAETALATLSDAGFHVVDSQFTPAFAAIGMKAAGLKTQVARLLRGLLYAISPNLLSKSLGGCSLLVLARRSGVAAPTMIGDDATSLLQPISSRI